MIDTDYREEIKILLINNSPEPFRIKKHDRIAQMILEKNMTPGISIIEKITLLNETAKDLDPLEFLPNLIYKHPLPSKFIPYEQLKRIISLKYINRQISNIA